MLHINTRVIAFFRRVSNLMDEKRQRGGGGEQCVIEREEAGVKVCEITPPPLSESDNLKLFSLGI